MTATFTTGLVDAKQAPDYCTRALGWCAGGASPHFPVARVRRKGATSRFTLLLSSSLLLSPPPSRLVASLLTPSSFFTPMTHHHTQALLLAGPSVVSLLKADQSGHLKVVNTGVRPFRDTS